MTTTETGTEMSALLQLRWQQLFAELPVGYFKFILNRDGRYQALQVPNQGRLWLPESEHVGKTIEEVLPPALAIDRRHFFEKALSTGQTQTYAYPHPQPQHGRAKSMEVSITPVPDSEDVLMTVCDVLITRIPDTYIVQP